MGPQRQKAGCPGDTGASCFRLTARVGDSERLYRLAHPTAAALSTHEGTAGLESHQSHEARNIDHRNHGEEQLDNVAEGVVHLVLAGYDHLVSIHCRTALGNKSGLGK